MRVLGTNINLKTAGKNIPDFDSEGVPWILGGELRKNHEVVPQEASRDRFLLWNPVGVRRLFTRVTQGALRDPGLWSGTLLGFKVNPGQLLRHANGVPVLAMSAWSILHLHPLEFPLIFAYSRRNCRHNR